MFRSALGARSKGTRIAPSGQVPWWMAAAAASPAAASSGWQMPNQLIGRSDSQLAVMMKINRVAMSGKMMRPVRLPAVLSTMPIRASTIDSAKFCRRPGTSSIFAVARAKIRTRMATTSSVMIIELVT